MVRVLDGRHGGAGACSGRKADRAGGSEQAAVGVDGIGCEQQAAYVEGRAVADQQAAGVIEPDVAALFIAEGRKARTALAGDGAVESDRPGRRGGADETVEDRILTGTIKFERVAGRPKVDRSAGRRAICRGPVYPPLRARYFDLGGGGGG